VKNLNTDSNDKPTIADYIRKNKIQLLIVLMTFVVIGGIYVVSKIETKEEEKHVEETYTLQTDNTPTRDVMKAGISVNVEEKKKIEQVSQEVLAAQVAVVKEKQQQIQQRLSAPLMLVNSSTKENSEPAVQDDRIRETNPNSLFLQNSSQKGVRTATAIAMGSLSTIIAAGNFIHAILEPATNSDLPGSLRAIVSEPVFAEDGSQVLIPQGSRLIGEYKSGMMQGQSRIFIVWQRLITPEGISVQLGSGGVDSLGVSGMGADSTTGTFGSGLVWLHCFP
jgi:type IV secretory pathway VirB10-like protein